MNPMKEQLQRRARGARIAEEIALSAWGAGSHVEYECRLAWANAALAYFCRPIGRDYYDTGGYQPRFDFPALQ
jgi:hypothetical protein